MILVDSSIWIAAWRGRDSFLIGELSKLVENNQASINWLIRTELLQGAKDRKHQAEIKNLLEPVPIQPFPENLWEEAPSFYLRMREEGVTLTTIDSLIASQSVLTDTPLWSLDGIFAKISGIDPSLKRFQHD